MKEAYADLLHIRRKVFAEIASLAYEGGDIHHLEKLVYKILPGEDAKYRDSIFLERAIVGERLRLALGLPVRLASDHGPLDEGIDQFAVEERVYEPPLVNVITFACMRCPTKTVYITDNCRKCLGHPCMNVCPKSCISFASDRAVIDQSLCIKCGRCETACPYHAIVTYDRPCAVACGVKAIGSDDLDRAKIGYDKCVSCGQCISACPFGAISDKGQIYQLVRTICKAKQVVAIVAPSFVGQFGAKILPEQIFAGIKALGFTDVMEVGLGADFTTLHESEEYIEGLVHGRNFMGTSCCNSWSIMVEKFYPEYRGHISETATPMIETAYYLKSQYPDAKVVFIGPCISKKLEALRSYVKDYVDFVITFEELAGLFEAKNIDLASFKVESALDDASKSARGYARAGGVAEAVGEMVKAKRPDLEIKIEGAEGLDDCMKLMKLASLGKKDGYLLEGMACKGGCIGGPGVLIDKTKTGRALDNFMKSSTIQTPLENKKLYEYGEEFHQKDGLED